MATKHRLTNQIETFIREIVLPISASEKVQI